MKWLYLGLNMLQTFFLGCLALTALHAYWVMTDDRGILSDTRDAAICSVWPNDAGCVDDTAFAK